MALNTPISIPLSAFDATQSQVFSFTVMGGDQVVGNKLTIIDNVSGNVVYTHEIESYVYNQTLPANTLTNGGYYAFYFQTININGDYSAQSDTLTFKCFTAPTLVITNIPILKVIESASYKFSCRYSQVEDEPIDYLYFYLYNSSKELVQQSDIYTIVDALPDISETIFEHTFNGLIDNETYYVRTIGLTINGTSVDSGYYDFSVDYKYDGTYMIVSAENKANSGYVLLSNNVSEIDGTVYDKDGNIIEPTLIGGEIYLVNGEELVWNEGFQFKNTQFTKIKWWQPVWLGETLVMSNGDNTYITIELKRRVPNGQSLAKDYILVSGYNNGVLYMRKMSALREPLNNMSYVETLVNVDGSNVTVLFNVVRGGDYAIWDGVSTLIFGINEMTYLDESSNIHNYIDIDEGVSNVEYDRLTDLFFLDEPQAPPLTDVDIIGEPTEYTEFTEVDLMNSIVDNIYISRNNILEIPEEFPEWDNSTVLRADFTNGTSAGNIDWFTQNVNNIKVKRRKKGDFDYITLYKHDITSVHDLNFEYYDYWLPSGYDFEYAFVACVDDDEGSYYFANVTTCFNGLFVSDGEKTMKLFSNYLINSAQDNQLIATVQPYNKRYPVIISNPNVNYRTATIQGDILGLKDNEFTFIMDRNSIVKQKQEWDEFLTNGKMKIVKDWNGNIIMGGITTAPSYSYNIVNQNAIPTITFSITEQGQYDSQEDLYNNGFINIQLG